MIGIPCYFNFQHTSTVKIGPASCLKSDDCLMFTQISHFYCQTNHS